MTFARMLLAGMLLLSFAGCSSVTVKTDHDPNVDFTGYTTFAMYDGDPIPGDDLAANPLIRARVVDSIVNYLTARGFEQKESGEVDFVVVVHAGVKEKTQVTTYGGGYYGSYGYYDPWWGPYGGRVDVSTYDEGTLIIDIVDYGSDKLAWRGMGTAIVGEVSTPEKAQKKADEYVAKILVNFPPSK